MSLANLIHALQHPEEYRRHFHVMATFAVRDCGTAVPKRVELEQGAVLDRGNSTNHCGSKDEISMSIEIEVASVVHITEPMEIHARRMRLQRPEVISGGYETEFKNLYPTNCFLWDGEVCFKCEGGSGEAVSLESGVQYSIGLEQRVSVVVVTARMME